MAERDREERPTTRLDPRSLGVLLSADDSASRPEQFDVPTALIRRDQLDGLIEQTAEPPPSRPHTIARDRLRPREPALLPADDQLDTNIRPSLSPLLWYAVLLTLAVVFIAATQLS